MGIKILLVLYMYQYNENIAVQLIAVDELLDEI
jgi:hypothetical protein